MNTNIEINVPNSSGTYSAYHPETSIDNIIELKRKKSTAYAVGDIAYHSTLPAGWYLKCTTAGTTSNSNLTITSPAINNIVTDGTAKWTIKSIDPEGKYLSLSGGNLTGTLSAVTELTLKNTSADLSLEDQSSNRYWFHTFCDKNGVFLRQETTYLDTNANGGSRGVVNWIRDKNDVGQSVFHYRIESDGYQRTFIQTPKLLEYSTAVATTQYVKDWGHFNNDCSHNAHFRGQNITDYEASGEMSDAIAAGNFENIFPGDSIIRSITLPAITYTDKEGNQQTQAEKTTSTARWLVAGINCYKQCGEPRITQNHVVLIADLPWQFSVAMNPTQSTEGGYLGSDMWRVHMANWSTAVENSFGAEHVLEHYELLTNQVSATFNTSTSQLFGGGCPSSNIYTKVKVNIPNVAMIFGPNAYGEGLFNIGDWTNQLPLYAHRGNSKMHVIDHVAWLRDVISTKHFAAVDVQNHPSVLPADHKYSNCGVLPYFLYV